jgi:hypothetical protein
MYTLPLHSALSVTRTSAADRPGRRCDVVLVQHAASAPAFVSSVTAGRHCPVAQLRRDGDEAGDWDLMRPPASALCSCVSGAGWFRGRCTACADGLVLADQALDVVRPGGACRTTA